MVEATPFSGILAVVIPIIFVLLGYVVLRWILKITGYLQKIDINLVRVIGAFLGSCVKVLFASLFIQMELETLILAMLVEGVVWAAIVGVVIIVAKLFERFASPKKKK